MRLPEITHLQFAVMAVLLNGDASGQNLRDALLKIGIRKSGPAFYQLMARLEDCSFVKGWYEQVTIGGQSVKERRYKLTATGVRAWERARDFYLEAEQHRLRGGMAHV